MILNMKAEEVNEFLRSLATDEERFGAIVKMLDGICPYCGQVDDNHISCECYPGADPINE